MLVTCVADACVCHRVRLVSLAAQSFLAGVTHDALQVAKRRKQASAWRQKELGYNARDQRLVLTSEDVAEALKEVKHAFHE